MELKGEQEELFYRLALTNVPGVGHKIARLLLERFGSAAAVFKAPLKELKTVDGISEIKAKGFRDADILKKAEKELEFVIRKDIQILHPDNNYPKRLSNCGDAPLVLFYKGNANLDATKIVAVVGTRKNTDYGHQITEELVEGLQALEGVLIVSGMALGIDGIAHRKILQHASRDFAGKGAPLLEVHVLGAHLYGGALHHLRRDVPDRGRLRRRGRREHHRQPAAGG